jgi:flagellum-specific peptidoglycan hydrolase FlgJ
MSTVEVRKGERIVVQAEFARYKSLLDCIECRDGILMRGASYAKARAARGNEDEFIREIATHWATDPRYAEKLEAVLSEIKGMLA